jgi:hypothetical protein
MGNVAWEEELKRQIVLTVSESKRLIARAVVQMPMVQRARREGVLVIATGTTNAYVLEEILGQHIDKRAYRSGMTVPKSPDQSSEPASPKIPDVVYRNGQIDPTLDRFTAVPHMGRGDVFIKGANALDYKNKMAGILIGGETGGTIGNCVGRVLGARINLVIPIGLEKQVYEDMTALSRLTADPDYVGPALFPVYGHIVTEIEALGMLTGVKATLLSAGGTCGAEGAVRLLMEGTSDRIDAAMTLASQVQGEPRYLL